MKYYNGVIVVTLFMTTLFDCSKCYHYSLIHKSVDSQFPYQTKYYATYIDHFTYKNDSLKFQMKYLISTDNWVKGNAILFYCGNEGSIELFANNSGFIWELGEQLSAMVVFAEHRFYGSSLPFGNRSFTNAQYFGYLNSEQALADYADLISFLKATITGAENSPVIAFGGSYGGMLAAWFRQKYPNIIAGSLAASAPVLMVGNMDNCNYAYQILTKAYIVKGSENCVKNVHNVWPILKLMNNSIGLNNLSSIFQTCQPLKSINTLIYALSDGLFSMGMANYPYKTDFLAPMPPWPVTEFCKPLSNIITDQLKLLSAFKQGIQVYFNYTGKTKCLPMTSITPGLDDNGWEIQTCTELPMPMCTNGITDMFYENNFDKEENDKNCQSSYGVIPRWGWGQTLFWSDHINSASNIIYSNGLLDPWSAGGVFNTTSPTIQIIKIPNGAHHVDLRKSNPFDTSDIRYARKLEKLAIEEWIRDWNSPAYKK